MRVSVLLATCLMISRGYVMNTRAVHKPLFGGHELRGLLDMMTLDGGSTLMFVHGNSLHMETANTVEEWVLDNSVTMMSVSLSNLEEFLSNLAKTIIEKNKISSYRKQLNFLVFCGRTNNCLHGITDMVSDKDRRYGKRSLFRHFSKWLFVLPFLNTSFPSVIDTELDNVALAVKLKLSKVSLRKTLLNKVQDENSPSFTCTHVMTLQWTNTEREWIPIGEPCSVTNVSTMFPNARRGLNGRKLTIAVLEWHDYCRKVPSPKHQPVTYTQICKDLFDSMASCLNFSYVFVESPDRSWGVRLPNTSWTGVLGMISRNEADLSGVPFGITIERSTVVTYSYMIVFSAYRVMYKKPNSEETSWFSLVSCFKLEVYLCGICAMVWCMGLVKVMEEMNVEPVRDWERRNTSYTSTTALSIIIAVQVPLRQGLPFLPRSLPSRVFYTFWWFFCIVITSVYTGNLIAILTVVRDKVPFNNIEELATNTEFSVNVPVGSYIEYMIKNSNDSVMDALWKKIVASRTSEIVGYKAEYQGYVKLLQSGNNAVIDEDFTVAATELKVKDLKVMKGTIIGVGMALPFPLNSPLADVFSEKLMLLYDNGMLAGWIKKWSTKRQDVLDNSKHAKPLTMTKFQSALAACASGIILATCTLGTELMIHRLRRI